MPLTYTGSGGIFTVLGKIFGAAQDRINEMVDLRTERNDILGAATAAQTTYLQNTLGGIDRQIADKRRALEDYRADAMRFLIAEVAAVVPLAAKTIAHAVAALADSMDADDYYVTPSVVSAGSVAAGRLDGSANTGNGTAVLSVLDALGLSFQYLPADTIELVCVRDSYARDAHGDELFEIRSGAARDGLDPDWPGGIGLPPSLVPALRADIGQFAAAPGRTILDNGDFEDIASDVPSKWNRLVGSGATATESATAYKGAKGFKFIGDGGGTKPKFEQTLNDSGAAGSQGDLLPSWRHLIAVAGRIDTGTTGEFRASVQDGSAAILDGAAAHLTINAATLSDASFTYSTNTFKTPANLPAVRKAVFEATTAINNTKQLHLDELMIAPMSLAMQAGPFVSVIAGSTPHVVKDRYTFAISNDQAGLFQKWFQRFFDMVAISRQLGRHVRLPTTGSNLINNSLVS